MRRLAISKRNRPSHGGPTSIAEKGQNHCGSQQKVPQAQTQIRDKGPENITGSA